MSWLLLAIIAYILTAFVAVSDKYFIEHRMPSALGYGFSVGVLGLVFLVAAPFGLLLPPYHVLLAAFGSGTIFTAALIILFWTLERGDVSRVIPALGAIFPIATLFLAWALLGERLVAGQVLAFIVLIASSLLFSVAREIGEGSAFVVLTGASAVALMFAVSSVLAKYVYAQHPFLSGFIWTRFFGGMAAVSLLAVPAWRATILGTIKRPGNGIGMLAAARFIAGGAFVLLQYAVSLGSVTLVNALKGVEYAAVFALTLFLSKTHPNIVKESFEKRIVVLKSLGIGGIIAGLWIIAYA